MTLLEVRNVGKRYGRDEMAVTALDGVSFALDAGRLLAVLGPSGSGKTTLLSIIAGLLQPTSGEVAIDGVPVPLGSPARSASFRRGHLGIAFQDPHLIPYLDATDNLLLIPSLSGRVRSADRARARQLLAEFGLEERAAHKPSALSGGERQRVAIARALMNEPRIMLVDEPTSNLDTDRGHRIMELLRTHIHAREMTCVMVTHDERMAEQADETLRLVDGRMT